MYKEHAVMCVYMYDRSQGHGLDLDYHLLCGYYIERDNCEIAGKEGELLMFSTRQHGGEYSIKPYQMCFLTRVFCVYV